MLKKRFLDYENRITNKKLLTNIMTFRLLPAQKSKLFDLLGRYIAPKLR